MNLLHLKLVCTVSDLRHTNLTLVISNLCEGAALHRATSNTWGGIDVTEQWIFAC
jgi:hypothetical protein